MFFCRKMKAIIRRSIRLQLIMIFFICSIAAGVAEGITSVIFSDTSEEVYHNIEREKAIQLTELVVRTIDGKKKEELESAAKNVKVENGINFLIVDEEGRVLYQPSDSFEQQIDLLQVITKVNSRLDTNDEQRYRSIYPINIDGNRGFIITKAFPTDQIITLEFYNELPWFIGFITFIMLFYYLSKGRMREIEELADGLNEISCGHLEHRIKVKSEDEIGLLADNINKMAKALQDNIAKDRQIEKDKNDMITNISHDLRTPLTSIMGYLRLIKEGKWKEKAEVDDYIQIVYGKSEQLKVLIDDLFEYSTLAHGSLDLKRENICINELLEQLVEEMVLQAEENQIFFEKEITSKPIIAYVNADKLVRAIENLIINAIKYSYKPGTIKIVLCCEANRLWIRVSNFSKEISEEDLAKVFDRFYKVDKARFTASEGSGLGLAIAKTIVEQHGGTIWAENKGEEITFVIQLERIDFSKKEGGE